MVKLKKNSKHFHFENIGRDWQIYEFGLSFQPCIPIDLNETRYETRAKIAVAASKTIGIVEEQSPAKNITIFDKF